MRRRGPMLPPMRRAALLLMATTILATGCGGGGGSSAELDLPGTSWTLADPGEATAPPTLQFAAATVSGSGGCNGFSGSYEVDGERLSFGPLKATQIGCPEPLAAAERRFFAALEEVSHGRLEDGELILAGDGGATLRLRATSPEGDWRATSLLQGNAVASLLAGTKITAELAADGSLTGSAGCNRYHARFAATGSEISIDGVAATKKSCTAPAGVMEQEQEYLSALSQARQYRLEAHGLVLLTAAGTILVTYEPAG